MDRGSIYLLVIFKNSYVNHFLLTMQDYGKVPPYLIRDFRLVFKQVPNNERKQYKYIIFNCSVYIGNSSSKQSTIII